VHAFLSVFGPPRNLHIEPTDTLDVIRLGKL
jgi:hypothetical protein